METLHPFEIIRLTPEQYDAYQHEIKRQNQMIRLINYVTKNEGEVLSLVITDLGINQVVEDFKGMYSLLTGNEVIQIVHQCITWPESFSVPPIGVKTDAPLLTVLHANTYDDEALLNQGKMKLERLPDSIVRDCTSQTRPEIIVSVDAGWDGCDLVWGTHRLSILGVTEENKKIISDRLQSAKDDGHKFIQLTTSKK